MVFRKIGPINYSGATNPFILSFVPPPRVLLLTNCVPAAISVAFPNIIPHFNCGGPQSVRCNVRGRRDTRVAWGSIHFRCSSVLHVGWLVACVCQSLSAATQPRVNFMANRNVGHFISSSSSSQQEEDQQNQDGLEWGAQSRRSNNNPKWCINF